MCFQPLGTAAFSVLTKIAESRVGARPSAVRHLSGLGDRRIDASLLTQRYSENWNVRIEGYERERQAKLLARLHRRKRE